MSVPAAYKPAIGMPVWSSTRATLSVLSPANVPKLPGTTFTAKKGPFSRGATQGFGCCRASPCRRLYGVAPRPKGVFAFAGVKVIVGDRSFKSVGIDPAVLGQFGDHPSDHDVAGLDVGFDRKRRRPCDAQTIATLECPRTDQPGCDLLARWHRIEHGSDVIVVTVALVTEPSAVRKHADDARFAAFDDVRKPPKRSVGK